MNNKNLIYYKVEYYSALKKNVIRSLQETGWT